MKILFLGYPDSPLIDFLKDFGDDPIVRENKLRPEDLANLSAEILISYGYRHILKSEILALFPRRAINLHISYLPWNRGADPNFWSFVDNTPKGVTIHLLDEGIDTGPIIAQKEVIFKDHETLSSSYSTLKREIEHLFIEWWPKIRAGNFSEFPQKGVGTCHKKADGHALKSLLSDGWDTPVSKIRRR